MLAVWKDKKNVHLLSTIVDYHIEKHKTCHNEQDKKIEINFPR